MDTITHLVLGHAMGVFAAGRTPAVQAGAYWGAFVGNSLPDIDVPVGYLMGRGWAFHRKFTHTVPGVLGLSLAAAGIITSAVPGSTFGLTWAWAVLGCVVHVGLDCLNLYGTRPLWPFSGRVVGSGVLFIMDPFILATLGLGSVLNLLGVVGTGAVKALYVLMWVYIAGRAGLRLILRKRVTGPDVRRSTIVPFFALWRYFRETSDRTEYGRVHVLSGRLTPIESVASGSGPAVEATRSQPQVQAFLQRARYPVAQVEQVAHGYRVVWQDLFARMRGWRSQVEVLLDPDLQPLVSLED